MTVYVEKPTINLREELAALRNQGGYQEQQFYFDGLVTNGTFDADTNWTKGTGWTISGGAANHASGTGSSLQQTIDLDPSKTYQVKVSATASGGTWYIEFRNGTTNTFGSGLSTGDYTFTVTPNVGNNLLSITAGSATVLTLDNVSIFETDGTDVVHRMPKGWVPKDVYEDGLLQREGAANDYEVVYDGFDYFVKPAVAPSATTQTCVIGVKA